MQTRNDFDLVEEPLDLPADPANAVRLIPVDFGVPDRTARETYETDCLDLAPVALACRLASLCLTRTLTP